MASPCPTFTRDLARKAKAEEVIRGWRSRPGPSLPRCAAWRSWWPGLAAGWRRCKGGRCKGLQRELEVEEHRSTEELVLELREVGEEV